MLWIKALHLIFMVTWFSGLFYLPRLFVYHAMSRDPTQEERFKVMERKLYYGITWPGAVLTTLFGFWLLSVNFNFYLHQGWMQAKLGCVVLLWIYHLLCGKYYKNFKNDRNTKSHVFYRWFNEVPVLLLAVIIILVIVKP